MGLPNRDEVEGKLDRAKGSAKKSVGRLIDDPDLQDEGEADRVSGNVQEKYGKTRRKIGEAIEDIGDKIAE
jgi:uncharacterized protein YjbJ (UPF0337 family)